MKNLFGTDDTRILGLLHGVITGRRLPESGSIDEGRFVTILALQSDHFLMSRTSRGKFVLTPLSQEAFTAAGGVAVSLGWAMDYIAKYLESTGIQRFYVYELGVPGELPTTGIKRGVYFNPLQAIDAINVLAETITDPTEDQAIRILSTTFELPDRLTESEALEAVKMIAADAQRRGMGLDLLQVGGEASDAHVSFIDRAREQAEHTTGRQAERPPAAASGIAGLLGLLDFSAAPAERRARRAPRPQSCAPAELRD